MDVGFVRTLFSSEALWHLVLLDQYDHRTKIDNGLDNPEIPGVHPRNRQIRSGQILLRKNLASVQNETDIHISTRSSNKDASWEPTGDPSGAVCPPDMFRCPEGKCIPLGKVCNYQRDCEKAEDELQSCRKCLWRQNWSWQGLALWSWLSVWNLGVVSNLGNLHVWGPQNHEEASSHPGSEAIQRLALLAIVAARCL
ncbi:Low-density lipoprotein receptor domain class A [Popillia japonica]|uniref:Low-density lipoprotein receptor domain class A n=1 Tax=Popillia japonica TaxID=7064 RepID=A0AAW1HVI7_POPJA